MKTPRPGKKRPQRNFFARRFFRRDAAKGAATSSLQHLLVILAFAMMVAMLTRAPSRSSTFLEAVDTTEVPKEDIRSTTYFETVDLLKTQAAQDQAAALVPDHYRVDLGRVQEQLEDFNSRVDALVELQPRVTEAVLAALRESTSAESPAEIVSQVVSSLAGEIRAENEADTLADATLLAEWLEPDVDSLPERVFAEASEEAIPLLDAPRPTTGLSPESPRLQYTKAETLRQLTLDSLRTVLTAGVRDEDLPRSALERPVVVVREAPASGQAAGSEKALQDLPDTATALEDFSARLVEAAKRAARDTEAPGEWTALHDAALALARPLVKPTLEFDRVATAGAREQARQNVPAVMRQITAGETIQEGGERWDPQSISDFETYRSLLEDEERPAEKILGGAFSHMILVGLVLFAFHKATRILKSGGKIPRRTKINLALLLMTATLVAGRGVSFFEPSGFVLPVAAAGILYAILVDVPLAAVVSVLTTFLVSVQFNYDWRVGAVVGAMSLAGAFSIFRVRRRSDMAGASLKAIVAGVLVMLAITLAMDSLFTEAALRRLALIVFNGCVCLVIVPGLLSPLERLFGITTDIQLLEYSDLNNEVLSRLAIEVPGTYAHSLLLGQIAEAAADAIGANGLMARVCAYYHDIGKMRRPEYFSENQTGRNIHDELSPRLSARAIAAHVIQGAKMAREHHLPRPIVDGILEHHGTCLIGYFHQIALEQQKHGDVREEDFRYPGPKPQSPETAILMICDASESGVRSIKNPNEERVHEFVDKIIASRSADGQFDECNLTLKQLSIIGDVVARRLISNMHTRVSYPAVKTSEKAANIISLTGGG